MASNIKWTVIGIDALQDSHDPDEYLAMLTTVDFTKPEGQECSYTMGTRLSSTFSVKSIIEVYGQYLKSVGQKEPSRVVIYTGEKTSQGVILRMLDQDYQRRSKSAKAHSTTFNYDGDNGLKISSYKNQAIRFNFTTEYEHMKKVFEDYLYEMADLCKPFVTTQKPTGMSIFIKTGMSANKCVRRVINSISSRIDSEKHDPEYPDKLNVSPSTCRREANVGMNTGGRMIAEEPFKEHKVMMFDINSMYSYILTTQKFSRTRELKVIPRMFFEDWGSLINLEALKEALDSHYNMYDMGWQMKIIVKVDSAILKNSGHGINLNKGFIQEWGGNIVKGGGCVRALKDASICLFFEEFIEFVKNYKIEGLNPRVCIFTLTRKFSKELRKYFYDMFHKALVAKKIGSQKYPSYKIQKNSCAGYYQMLPVKGQEQDYMVYKNAYDAGRKYGNFDNILAGAEITFQGRMFHRRIQNYFESNGFKVVYSHTDSFAVEYRDGEEEKLLHIVQELNDFIQNNYHVENRDLHPKDLPLDEDIGCLKLEAKGTLIHAGVNNMFVFDEDGQLIKSAVSGVNINDLGINNKSQLYKGVTVENVPYVVGEDLSAHIVYKPWSFDLYPGDNIDLVLQDSL